jgi:L-ascorbate metabolism protein UlaG (beta-lactamase superfamily)
VHGGGRVCRRYTWPKKPEQDVTHSALAITWLGHGTFHFRTPCGQRLLIDPWLETNPRCPAAWKKPTALDGILITHGHADHATDAASVAKASGAPVIASFEVCTWLGRKGVKNLRPMNKGGTQALGGVHVSMVDARHSSSIEEDGVLIPLGEAGGFVLTFEDGLTLYFSGDTSLFGDMRLIAELYKPVIACIPIGDLFTMGPAHAAKACEWLGVKQVVPMHYGTFPALTGTPDMLRAHLPSSIEVLELQPGETSE